MKISLCIPFFTCFPNNLGISFPKQKRVRTGEYFEIETFSLDNTQTYNGMIIVTDDDFSVLLVVCRGPSS